jgi:hypothetical protein
MLTPIHIHLSTYIPIYLYLYKLMAERQKRLQLESELDGYKEELRESFRVIVELR